MVFSNRTSSISSILVVLALALVAVSAAPVVFTPARVITSIDGKNEIEIVLALRIRNKPQLESLLMDVSNPQSANYGKYPTIDEIASIAGASEETFSQLSKWIKSLGGHSMSLTKSKTFLHAKLPLAVAQELVLQQQDYLPKELSHLVHVVTQKRETIQMNYEAEKLPSSSSSSAPSGALWKFKNFSNRVSASPAGDPNAQKTSYQIPLNQTGTNLTNSQMVWGTGTFGFASSDLAQFYTTYNISNPLSNLIPFGMAGTVGGDNFGEGTLDTTYISSLGVGIATIVANTDNSSDTEWGPGFGPALLNFVDALSNHTDLPYVLSMSLGSLSWASCNDLCVQSVINTGGSITYDECVSYMQSQRQVCMYTSAEETEKINDELLLISLQGVTILAATGDGGSHFSFQPFDELNKIGRALNNVSCHFNFPTFPASSPYLLAVGGTQWEKASPAAPIAWTASGGAFSWQFPMLDYQRSAVNHYLQTAKGLPPAYSFNATNRAYPDVAALADGVPMVYGGKVMSVGGTSASTPAFAGIISLLNDIRLNKGLPTLGFVNTRIYQVAAAHPGEAFYDVTVGNTACASDGFCCSNGFPASAGWDPTTGLGSPLWSGLLKYLGSD